MSFKGGSIAKSIVTMGRTCGLSAMLLVAVGVDGLTWAAQFEGPTDAPSVLAEGPDDDQVWLSAPQSPNTAEGGYVDSVPADPAPADLGTAYVSMGLPTCSGPQCGATGCGGNDCGGAGCGTCNRCCEGPGLLQYFGMWHDKSKACWTGRADALILWRNAPQPRPIYSTIAPQTGGFGPTALDASNLNSDVLAAPRLSLFRTDCNGRTLEATYLYAGNFYSDRTVPYSPNGYAVSPPGIYGNALGPTPIQVDAAQAKLLGQLQSLEFNTRHCIGLGSCQFLMGARWLQWNETLSINDMVRAPSGLPGFDSYQTRCFNNLWGGQIGLDSLLLGSAGMARIEGLVKAGAYYNHAGQISTATYVVPGDPNLGWNNAARADGPAAASFVGEVGMTAVMPITANCDFRCGYFGLWLSNLAQPTRQLSGQTIGQPPAPAVATLNTGGYVMLQGLSLGLESRW